MLDVQKTPCQIDCDLLRSQMVCSDRQHQKKSDLIHQFLNDKRILHILQKIDRKLEKNEDYGYVKKCKFDDVDELLGHFRECKNNNLELPPFKKIYNKIKKFSIHDMFWKASQFYLLDDVKFIKTLIENKQFITAQQEIELIGYKILKNI
jgi:hypothetical protein